LRDDAFAEVFDAAVSRPPAASCHLTERTCLLLLLLLLLLLYDSVAAVTRRCISRRRRQLNPEWKSKRGRERGWEETRFSFDAVSIPASNQSIPFSAQRPLGIDFSFAPRSADD